MSEPSDQQLLSAWAERRDEAAFRSLLGRYAGFVYGSTLRRVGDPGLAEEIAQDVFARLSWQASRLLGHPTLAGWLHRSAMLLALDRLRRRTRHARKLERFSLMNDDPPAAHDPWADARPHLDEALDRLATRDREVLLLHYAEGRTFPEIAAHLGSTADAVRMRAHRALTTLSRTLGRKGAILPTTALAAGLGGTFAQASVPAKLAALAPTALAGLGHVGVVSITLHALQTMKTVQATAVTALALVLSVPLVFQERQIAAAETRIATLQRLRDASTGPNSPQFAAGATKAPTPRVVVANESIDLKQLGEDALDDGYFGLRRLQQAAARLDNNNLTGLIETVLHSDLLPEPKEELLKKLLAILRRRDPPLFLEWSMKVLAGTVSPQALRSSYAYALRKNAAEAFREWMASQPALAATWAENNTEAWQQFGGISLESLTIAGLLRADPPRAYAMFAKLSAQQCTAVMSRAVGDLTNEQAGALAHWAASSVTDPEKRCRLVRRSLWSMPESGQHNAQYLESIRPQLLALSLNADDLTWVASRLAADSTLWTESDLTKEPKDQIAWLEKILPADHLAYAEGALGHFYQPQQALIYLNAQLDRAPNDDLIAGYVESPDMKWHQEFTLTPSGGNHGETAFRLATRVEDSGRRVDLLVKAWTDLHADSQQAARAILTIPQLHADDRVKVEARIAPLLKKSTP